MKKEYKSPVAFKVPLSMDQSLCQGSIVKYILIADDPGSDFGPTKFDDDSD